MGCCGGSPNTKKQQNAKTKQPAKPPSTVQKKSKPAYTPQQAEAKRRELRQGLAQGASQPPQPHYPRLKPISNIQ